MQKTAKVLVERLWKHPFYQKRVKRSKHYLVQDDLGVKSGDKVIIQECRPVSKRKRFRIIKVIR
ncbi:30S ribosomal protein S17 [Candidatus Beckwithbacteria bacterium RBG_13_35_6]|uniref:30S ribosomal protein S17 n=1 Tax=Candidatus Beckwithbacteria bacterium RBG_13_35_6 TaxID=1797456 RepID=A0A1F5DFP2_9BACT|nr:MAG: 30S ribosomal protein S17 [Candidatus Beckwithbacteria bacterium RBG_13_35_6]